MTQQATITDELAFSQPYGEQEKQILTPEAVEFLTELVSRFTPARNKLLAARLQQQQAIDDGQLPDFISETDSIRNGDWTIRGIRLICRIAALKSPAPSSARWSLTR
ncbi:malate synthase [Klebsiella pneumoniae]|uniref:Malate synthase n=1 Tax=Klebsiella pneumoniae TaxID=573 RepID=A0A377TI80_KLEPN|nr:malate synthase [Klebsiella pneumoniae]